MIEQMTGTVQQGLLNFAVSENGERWSAKFVRIRNLPVLRRLAGKRAFFLEKVSNLLACVARHCLCFHLLRFCASLKAYSKLSEIGRNFGEF